MTGNGNEIRPEQAEAQVLEPIIVDLGKKTKKQLKQLKQCQGKVWDEVESVIDEVRSQAGAELNEKLILPIVIIYRRKSKRRARNPFLPFRRT